MPPPSHHHVSPSTIGALIQPERIDALLARWVPEPEARAFVSRCILEAGPAHHRGANYVLLLLLAHALDRLDDTDGPPSEAEHTVQISMRLPAPHVISRSEQTYPLRMDITPLLQLADGDERRLAAMIDCLSDGPPQHALANAVMVNALGRLLERLEARPK